MSSIDERVVRMQFDNAQFEKGVQQTIRSMSSLEKALDVKTAAKSLGAISTAASNISFSGAANSLTAFGAQADSVFVGLLASVHNVTSAVEALGSNLVSKALTQAVTGGWARAANIENAKFQLEGLGVAYEDVYKSMDRAVKGTPFGIDSAAKAASQLVASGVQVGEQMDKALLGISGVAVMTNSTYDDIANIFTTVAGNGKLMTMQMRQISARGLNVAAALAKQLNVTEAEVNDMVSKGQIDFQTFANAMDDAFGSHAKEADKTFNGAVSNMNAALSRLGQPFAETIRNMGHDAAIGTRQIIENLITAEKQTRELFSLSGESLGEWSIVSSFQENFTQLGKTFGNAMTMLAQSGKIKDFVSTALVPLDAIFRTLNMSGQTLINGVFQRLANLPQFDTLQNAMDAIGNSMRKLGYDIQPFLQDVVSIGSNVIRTFAQIGENIGSVVGPALGRFFQGLAPAGEAFLHLSDALVQFSADVFRMVLDLKPGEDVIQAISQVAGDLGSALGNTLAAGLNFVADHLPDVINLLRQIGEVLNHVREAIQPFAEQLFNLIGSVLQGGLANLATVISDIGNAFRGLGDLAGKGLASIFGRSNESASVFENIKQSVTNLSNEMSTLSSRAKTLYSNLTGRLTGAADTIRSNFDRIKQAFQVDGSLGGKFGSQFDGLKAGLTALIAPFHAVTNSMGSFLDRIKEIAQTVSWKDLFGALVQNLPGLIKDLLELKLVFDFDRLTQSLTGFVTNLKGLTAELALPWSGMNGLPGILGVFRAFKFEAYTQALKNFAIAIGILAASLFLISAIPEDRLTGALGSVITLVVLLAAVGGALITYVNSITKALSPAQVAGVVASMAAIAAALIALSVSVAILAGSVALLALIPTDRMIPALLGIIGLVLSLAAAAKLMQNASISMIAVGAGLAAMSVGILTLAVAVGILSMIPMDRMLIGLAAVMTMILGLTTMLGSDYMAKSSGKVLAVSAALIGIAAAMLVLTASVAILGNMPLDALVKGVATIAVVLAGIVVMGKAVTGSAKSLIGAAVAMDLMTGFLLGLTISLGMLSTVDPMGLVAGILSIAAALAVLIGAMYLMPKDSLFQSMALSGLAGALVSIAMALKMVGSIPVEQLAIAAITLGLLTLALVGISAVAAPLIPAMIGLSLALLTLSLGLTAIGGAVALFAVGMRILAELAEGSLDSIGAGLEQFASHLGSILGNLGSAIGAGIVSLATALGENAGALATAGLTLVESFLGGLGPAVLKMAELGMQFIMALLSGIQQNMGQIASTAAQIIANLIMGIASQIGAIIQAAIMLAAAFITGLADGLRTYGPLVLDAVNSLVLTIGAALLGGLADVVQNIPGVGQAWADGLRGTADDMNAAAEELSQGVHKVIDEEMSKITPTAENAMGETAAAISGSEGEMSGAADNALGGLLDSVGVKLDELPGMAEGKMDELMSTLEGSAGPAEEAGQSAGEGYYDGFENPMNQLPAMAQGKTQEAVNAAGSVPSWGSGYGVGSDFGAGMVNGVGAWAGSLAEKAASMVRDAVAKAKEAQKSASPSKVMYQVGSWFGEGYALGIGSMITTVGDTARDMAQAGVNEASGLLVTMSDLMSGVDWDADPVITPVLDTTALEDGMNRVNGLLPKSTIGTEFMSNYAGLIPAIGGNGKTFVGDIYVTLDYTAGSDAMEMVDGIVSGLEDRLNLEA